MQVAWHWLYFEGTVPCPSVKDLSKATDAKRKTIEDWKFEDLTAQYLLSQWLHNSIVVQLLSLTTAKA
jgi:hypothetical protein